MWFFLGIVAFTLSTIYFYNLNIGHTNKYNSFRTYKLGKKYYKANFGNQSQGASLKLLTDKNVLEVAVEANTNLSFVLTPETSFDRWARKVKLAIEPQTGNKRIDDSFYLDCFEDHVAKKLNNTELEIKFQALLETSFLNAYACQKGSIGKLLKASIKLIEIRSTGKYFSAKFKCSEPFENITPVQESLAELCFVIANLLDKQRDKNVYPWWKDKNHHKSTLLLSTSSSLGIMGAFEYVRLISSNSISKTLDYSSINLIWGATLPLGLIALAGAVIIFMKRSANTHIILKDMLLVGGVGLSIYWYSLIYDLNILMDKSTPVSHHVLINDKKKIITRGKNSRTYYKLYLTAPSQKQLKVTTLDVDYRLFNALQTSDCLDIKTKIGFFGAIWIYQLEKAVSCNDPSN